MSVRLPAMFSSRRTLLWRWRERVSTTPPLLSGRLLLQALRGQGVSITNELPAVPPLFMLATGRCGTQTLAFLMALAPQVKAFHEPMPDLYNLARLVHLTPETDQKLVSEALLLARSSLWQATNMANKRYVETSNHATFLAPFLFQLLPDARFLHITRTPEAFARSATNCGWYSRPRLSGNRHAPRPDSSAAAGWNTRDAFGKNVWLWQEVNSFARDFLQTLPPGQGLHLRSEDIFSGQPEALHQLFTLVDSEPPERHRIERVLGRQINAGRYHTGSRPPEPGSDHRLELLQQQCGALARQLGYESVKG